MEPKGKPERREVSTSGVLLKRSESSRPPTGPPPVLDERAAGSGSEPRARHEKERDRRALLVAAEAVISEKGFARTSVEEVTERAKLDPQIFYAHFQGMGALLRVHSELFVEQMVSVTDQATRSGIWKGAPARDVVEVAVRSILDVVIDRRGLVRAFLSHGATDEAIMIDLRKIGTYMAQRIVAVLAECTNAPARPSRAVAFSLLVSVALAHHYILVGDEWSGVSFSKEQLQEEASQAICAYLGLHPTISILQDTPDLAPTDMIEALRTDEIQAAHEEATAAAETKDGAERPTEPGTPPSNS